jgi:hypothetical protein
MAGVTVFRQLSRLKGVSLTLLKEDIMPSANRMTTPVAVDEAQIEGRYAPPGHLPLVTAGTAVVEFSPTADLEATMAVVQKNLTGSGARA